MERTISLTKGAYLWEEGDAARSVIQLKEGKLGVEIQGRSVGAFFPRVILGESALLDADEDGNDRTRTASVVALEDNTRVIEHFVPEIRTAFEQDDHELTGLILKTIIAQFCKNCLLVSVANPDVPLISKTLTGLAQELAKFKPSYPPNSRWPRYLADFRFLYDLRDYSDHIRDESSWLNEEEIVDKASRLVSTLYSETGLMDLMESFIRSEREALLTG